MTGNASRADLFVTPKTIAIDSPVSGGMETPAKASDAGSWESDKAGDYSIQLLWQLLTKTFDPTNDSIDLYTIHLRKQAAALRALGEL